MNDDLLPGPLDLDLGNPRPRVLLFDVLADLLVLDQELGEVLLARIPGAQPVGHNADAKAGRSNFLTHWLLLRPFVADRHDHVGIPLLDRVRGTAGPRLDSFENRPAVNAGFDHDQVVDVAGAAV